MADIEQVLLKRSDEVVSNSPKLPSTSDLEYGEVALNYADGHETLSIKNNNNEIVTFSSDSVLDQKYVSSANLSSLSGSVVALSAATLDSDDVEGIIESYGYITGYTETDPTVPSWAKENTKPSYTASEVGALSTGATLDDVVDGTTRKLSNYVTITTYNGHTGDTTAHVTSGEKSTWNGKQDEISDLQDIRDNAAAGAAKVSNVQSDWDATTGLAVILNKPTIPSVDNYFDDAEYVSSAKTIVFTNNGVQKATIDATDFIKDGMVSSVTISGGNMVITFNTDAGHEDITLSLAQIFNPNNYYTKDATDEKFVTSAQTKTQIEGYGYTTNVGTITGINMNGESKGTSGVVDLGTVLTSFTETQLSTATTGTGNAITDLTVSNHQISITKGSTFTTSGDVKSQIEGYGYITSYTETDPIFTGSPAYGITSQNITDWSNLESNVQSDWNATTGSAVILNKPTSNTAFTNDAGFITGFTETQLSTGNTSGTGNVVTSLSVSNHQITMTKGMTIPDWATASTKPSYTASEVGALPTGTTLDNVADGTTRKLSDYATSANVTTLSASTTGINATLTAHTGNTGIHLPAVTSSDNGKVLQVVNGVWTLVTPVTVYTGSNTPSDSLGNNGDIYIQI